MTERGLGLSQSQPVLVSNDHPGSEPSAAWLPIESAPRDGTRIVILVGSRPQVLTAHWYTYTGRVPGDHSGWADDYGHEIMWRQELVTHWMPLPSADAGAPS